MQTPQDFSQDLQRRLDERNWNISELAKRMSVDISTAGRWLRETMPRRKTLMELAAVLGVSSDDLASWLALLDGGSRVAEAPASYIPRRGKAPAKASAEHQMMMAMITIIGDVISGEREKDDLDQVHALLDLVHPMQHKEDPPL